VKDKPAELLAYINGELLSGKGVQAASDTRLFEDGWIDSLSILKLIAFIELMTGQEIPDEQVVMENFQSVNQIAHHFGLA
jgi:acyl carrier protein